MSLHEELRAAQRCVDDLARCVSRLEQELGSGLDVRRVRSDADHLRESLALLTATHPFAGAGPAVAGSPGDPTAPGGPRGARGSRGTQSGQRPEQPIGVSDTPYDHRLWAGADDEGLGCRR